ncbi:hypothetical protein [Morganella morganii IS15]|nr:hypothetical protein CSB69_1780 [Morganella morganii]EMP53640.1 hypothetical protein C790_00156 [Morganella morganii SC01]CDK67461.1 hypothetical protein [Morganella morganii IS15]
MHGADYTILPDSASALFVKRINDIYRYTSVLPVSLFIMPDTAPPAE